MSADDRERWDARYRRSGPSAYPAVGPPAAVGPFTDLFPTSGHALDLACGTGSVALWLAGQGLDVLAVDVSPVAIDAARRLAASTEADRAGTGRRCRFAVADLDDGLPPGPPADVLSCQRFRDARLDRAMIERLAPGGLLTVSALSEVGGRPGSFRAATGELARAFGVLEVITAGERDGLAWLLARRPI